MLTLVASVATFTGLCTSALPTVQIRTMLRERSAGGVSLVYLSGSLTNAAIWTGYGALLGNTAIVAPNLLWVGMCVAQISIVLHLRRTPAPPPAELVARALVADPVFAGEFHALVQDKRQEQFEQADTLILRPRAAAALTRA